jgi:hypothetical protein
MFCALNVSQSRKFAYLLISELGTRGMLMLELITYSPDTLIADLMLLKYFWHQSETVKKGE